MGHYDLTLLPKILAQGFYSIKLCLNYACQFQDDHMKTVAQYMVRLKFQNGHCQEIRIEIYTHMSANLPPGMTLVRLIFLMRSKAADRSRCLPLENTMKSIL